MEKRPRPQWQRPSSASSWRDLSLTDACPAATRTFPKRQKILELQKGSPEQPQKRTVVSLGTVDFCHRSMTPQRPKRHENRSPRARPTGTLEPICSEQVVTRFNPSLVVLMTILQKGSVTKFLRRRFKLIRGRIIGVAKLRNFATFVARFNSLRVPKLAVLTIRTGMSGTETTTSKNPKTKPANNKTRRTDPATAEGLSYA